MCRQITMVLAPCAIALAAAAAPPIVVPPSGANELVMRLSDGFGEAAGNHEVAIEIYGDGRVVVTRPDFVRGSARAEARVTLAEVQGLLDGMVAHGVFEFDASSAREELKAAQALRAEQARANPLQPILRTWTDPDPTVLEVHAASYSPQGAGGPVEVDAVRVIKWVGLRGDATIYPEVDSLRRLHEAQEELRAVRGRTELQ
jgi:hypothetical protein